MINIFAKHKLYNKIISLEFLERNDIDALL